jgi:hypothetical protein
MSAGGNHRSIGSTPHRDHNKMITSGIAASMRDKNERKKANLLKRHKRRFKEAALFLDERGIDTYEMLDDIFS